MHTVKSFLHYLWGGIIFFFQIYILIGEKLLFNVLLVSAVQQCKSAIIIHILPLY